MPACRITILCLPLVLLVWASTSANEQATKAPPAVTRPAANRHANDGERTGDRQREGTRLTDVIGRFELAGDRITFYPAGGRDSFRVLENLSLERVGQVLTESRARHEWTISGVLTEYRGTNYLLLTKAVVKSAVEGR